MEKTLVIINPNSGARKGRTDWPLISELLTSSGVQFEHCVTLRKDHAKELTVEYIKNGYSTIIVVGGDGTLNEVVNGIFSQKDIAPASISVGLIPIGTGNDWARMFNIPTDYQAAINRIISKKKFMHDVGCITFQTDHSIQKRFFINIAGLGFEGLVVKNINDKREHKKLNKLSYMGGLLASLKEFNPVNVELEVDGIVLHRIMMSLCICICRYNGGGMIQAPLAKPNDGLFDLTMIKDMKKIEVILNINKLFKGTITKHPKVESFQGKNIKITTIPKVLFEADGEDLGYTPLEITIFQEALSLLI